MKKITLIGIITLVSFTSFSQNKIGVFTSITSSTLSDGLFNSSRLGNNSFSLNFGAVYEMKLNEKISFRPKLIYAKQGDKEKIGDHLQYEATYINAPLNLKLFKSPYLLVGPQIGFLINTKKNNIDFGDLSTFDYGANLGLGVNLNDFFIEFTMYKGFNKLIDTKYQIDRNNEIDIKVTNFTALFSIGYNFI